MSTNNHGKSIPSELRSTVDELSKILRPTAQKVADSLVTRLGPVPTPSDYAERVRRLLNKQVDPLRDDGYSIAVLVTDIERSPDISGKTVWVCHFKLLVTDAFYRVHDVTRDFAIIGGATEAEVGKAGESVTGGAALIEDTATARKPSRATIIEEAKNTAIIPVLRRVFADEPERVDSLIVDCVYTGF